MDRLQVVLANAGRKVEIKGLNLREDSQISHEEKCGSSKCSAETGRRVHPLNLKPTIKVSWESQ